MNPIIGAAVLVILIVYIVNYLLRPRDEEAYKSLPPLGRLEFHKFYVIV